MPELSLVGHVRFLDLSDTDIRGSACITLAAACKADGERNSFRQQLTCMPGALCKIEDLRLCSNSIGDKGCVVLLDELKNCSSLQYATSLSCLVQLLMCSAR